MPNILNIIIRDENKKIILFLFIERSPKKLVILDLLSLIVISSVDKKFSNVGNKVNVIVKDIINPKVIIQPKSIIGFISLKINDKKAQIVVKTVYIIGQNILLVVNKIISELLKDGLFFFNCTKRVLI